MPLYENPNAHPVVVSITEPRISLTVFPAAWSTLRMPQGARQSIELDEILARVFIRIGMLRLKVMPAAAITATTTSTGSEASSKTEPYSLQPSASPTTATYAEESPASVTEENLSPSEQAVRATTDSDRLPARKRLPSPPKKQRYTV